jgi:bifunctional N-acetylglucosamine-1-phosphate-uridyltransferase/glucosamine-1-phosphate-acetyltransferase GlmU-like protein
MRKYDLVLIDESEQVLRHLSSDTIERRPGGTERCFAALDFFVRNAKSVVVLDADMSLLTAHALKSTGGRTSNPGIKTFFSHELRDVVMTTLKFSPRYEIEF